MKKLVALLLAASPLIVVGPASAATHGVGPVDPHVPDPLYCQRVDICTGDYCQRVDLCPTAPALPPAVPVRHHHRHPHLGR